jgi:hypothetical protein
MPLFAAAPPSRSDVARDLIEERFGEGALTRASLLTAEALRPAGGPAGGDGKRRRR